MTTTPADGHTRVRRCPVAHTDDDPRFTLGLILDVTQVLEQHGYPPLTGRNAEDLVELRQALFAFLYTGGGERV